jgi:hypothetical protein
MTLSHALKELLQAAQRFEIKTPQYKRIESERQALREAMTHAQLVLSVQDSVGTNDKNSEMSLPSISGGRSWKKRK